LTVVLSLNGGALLPFLRTLSSMTAWFTHVNSSEPTAPDRRTSRRPRGTFSSSVTRRRGKLALSHLKSSPWTAFSASEIATHLLRFCQSVVHFRPPPGAHTTSHQNRCITCWSAFRFSSVRYRGEDLFFLGSETPFS